MNLPELILTAVGLSMDAFSVAVCKGLSVRRLEAKYYFIIGAWFGGFQALMPILGYWLGAAFAKYVDMYAGWIAFGLLAFVGIRMIIEGAGNKGEELNESFSARSMFVLALATSIDALAVGVTLSLMPNADIFGVAALIGCVTFALSALGLRIGNIFGAKFKSAAEIIGGVILVAMGLMVLIEDLTAA